MITLNYTKQAYEHYSRPIKMTDGFRTWYETRDVRIITKKEKDGTLVPELLQVDITPRSAEGEITPVTVFGLTPQEQYEGLPEELGYSI